MPVVFEDEDTEDVDETSFEDAQDSRFYSCQVCGDNWLRVKETPSDGTCVLTFVHQMGTSPVLRRVAHMDNAILLEEEHVETWEYFLGEEEVDKGEWYDCLSERRETLKASCVN